MELKKYQHRVMRELDEYLDLLDETQRPDEAFRSLWASRGAPDLGAYHNVIDRVPCLTLKVPTGGGKTYLACCAIKRIFDRFQSIRRRAVVWLVPSESILTQTLANLKTPDHPYRQRLNADFCSRVEVYGKRELLDGQNFNETTVLENLSVMVLSYDSFKNGRGVEARKAYQDNSNIRRLGESLGAPDLRIENADELSLIQTVNKLHPIVIVDESHHARSKLSVEMLKNFDPTFVLELTATPIEHESNVISYVDAAELKAESMVKLPVIVYNRPTSKHVVRDAVEMRNSLERLAKEEASRGGRYVRPIVLFQAEPKTREDSETFDKIKQALLKRNIPEEEIAIKTGEKNELKNVDLLSKKCKIRYIITIDALREGWDCPFAYILASIANRASVVSVEQILGRVLRLPNAAEFDTPLLNMAYVLTSSAQFQQTLSNIKIGLENAGFTEREYRADNWFDRVDQPQPVKGEQKELLDPPQQQLPETDDDETPDLDLLPDEIEPHVTTQPSADVATAFANAQKAAENYAQQTQEPANSPFAKIPPEVAPKMKVSRVNEQFADDIKELRIPRFMMRLPDGGLFGRGVENSIGLTKENLASSFSLTGQNSIIDFDSAPVQMVSFDVRNTDKGRAKMYDLGDAERDLIKAHPIAPTG